MCGSFAARYASFGVLENDDQTRRFLGVEIGQGYDQVSTFSSFDRTRADELSFTAVCAGAPAGRSAQPFATSRLLRFPSLPYLARLDQRDERVFIPSPPIRCHFCRGAGAAVWQKAPRGRRSLGWRAVRQDWQGRAAVPLEWMLEDSIARAHE